MKHRALIWIMIAIAVAVALAAVMVHVYMKRPTAIRRSIPIEGAVIRRDADSHKELPI